MGENIETLELMGELAPGRMHLRFLRRNASGSAQLGKKAPGLQTAPANLSGKPRQRIRPLFTGPGGQWFSRNRREPDGIRLGSG
jgi:hypothetical protein